MDNKLYVIDSPKGFLIFRFGMIEATPDVRKASLFRGEHAEVIMRQIPGFLEREKQPPLEVQKRIFEKDLVSIAFPLLSPPSESKKEEEGNMDLRVKEVVDEFIQSVHKSNLGDPKFIIEIRLSFYAGMMSAFREMAMIAESFEDEEKAAEAIEAFRQALNSRAIKLNNERRTK